MQTIFGAVYYLFFAKTDYYEIAFSKINITGSINIVKMNRFFRIKNVWFINFNVDYKIALGINNY